MEGEGFEPSNSKEDGFTVRCVWPLRYPSKIKNDPYGIRTRDTAVKGRCLNHLTKGPYLYFMCYYGPE